MFDVALVKYKKPYDSLQFAIQEIGGLGNIASNAKVFIKPNIVIWEEANFPKYGVITTARILEDMVIFLNEHGINDVALIEGIVEQKQCVGSSLESAIRGIGLDSLSKKYGLKFVDVHRGQFTRVTLDDVSLSVNADILESDYIINIPVLKTHVQCMVSLSIKNLKGLLHIKSRKKCHSKSRKKDLDYHLIKLSEMIKPSLTIIDGIYSLEYGPAFNGNAYRSNLIIASKDMISADKVGARALGYEPGSIPHIANSAENKGRAMDLSDINLKGDVNLEDVMKSHKWTFERNQTDEMPLIFEQMGITGVKIPAIDNTLCTYCVEFLFYVIMGILMSTNSKKSFDDIEILHGKIQEPSGTHKNTLLVGQCQVNLNKQHQKINNCHVIGGCPPSSDQFIETFYELGIGLPDEPKRWMENVSGFFAAKYKGKPEYEETFYRLY